MTPWDEPAATGVLGALYRWRRLLVVLGLSWFTVAIAGGIFLSQIDAREGLHIFGAEIWVADRPSSVRIGLRNLRFGQFLPLGPVRARFRGRDGVVTEEQRLAQPVGDFVQGTLHAPPFAGNWTLLLSAIGPNGPVRAEVPLKIAEAAPTRRLPTPPEPRQPNRLDQGPWRLDIAPLDGVLPGGLPSRLVVAVKDAAGRPVATPIEVKLERGRSVAPLPSRVITGADGLADFAVHPAEKVFWFEMKAGESSTKRKLADTSTQVALELPGPRFDVGAAVPLRIRSLHRSAPLFIDVWDGPRWLTTATATLADGEVTTTLTVPAPDQTPALLWLQVYRNPYLPGDARDGRYLVVGAGSPDAAHRWLTKTLRAAGHAKAELDAVTDVASPDPDRLTRYLLGRVPRPERNPPLLADSGDTAREAVAAMRATWQTRLIIALVGGGAVLFAVMALLLGLNYRDVEQRWADSGVDEEAMASGGTRKHYFVGAVYMFGVIALFVLAVVQLLVTIRW